jgi:coenzyme PQQ biosynthesis protein PqqD
MTSSDRYPRRRTVPWRTLDTEALVVDVTGGRVYPLNQVAARIWQLCDGVRTVDAIVQALAEEFDAEEALIRRDVERFIEELAGAQLVDVMTAPAPGEGG